MTDAPGDQRPLKFSGWIYQPDIRELRRDRGPGVAAGRDAHILRPKAGALLLEFLRHPHKVRSHEVLEAVFLDAPHGGASLYTGINELRERLGDKKAKKLIQTVTKAGYLLAADVTPVDDEDAYGSSEGWIGHGALAPSFRDLSQASAAQLERLARRDSVRIGWGHHLKGNPVTDIGSAYGLRILQLAGVMRQQWILGHEVAQQILDRSVDGLWGSTSGGSRLEATAWVLLGLVPWVSPAALRGNIDAFEELLKHDKVAQRKVLSTTLAIQTLLLVRPQSPLLKTLQDKLRKGCVSRGDGQIGWGEELPTTSANACTVAHTALAVLALLGAHRNAAPGPELLKWLAGTKNWMLESDWADHRESITRYAGSVKQELVVDHFTAAIAIRALSALGVAGTVRKMAYEIRELVRGSDGGGARGLWARQQRLLPIWATWDALMTLRDWSMRQPLPH
jgi:DNA-binding winged helix-turn-helix (wHTH) protein